MKFKLMAVLLFLFPTISFADSFIIVVSTMEMAIMEDSILDVETWINAAVDGKINNCKSRVIKREVDLAIKNGESLPAGEDAIVNQHFSRPDYKNRKDRDAEK